MRRYQRQLLRRSRSTAGSTGLLEPPRTATRSGDGRQTPGHRCRTSRDTWLGDNGLFHTATLKVTDVDAAGHTLKWKAIVEDPEVQRSHGRTPRPPPDDEHEIEEARSVRPWRADSATGDYHGNVPGSSHKLFRTPLPAGRCREPVDVSSQEGSIRVQGQRAKGCNAGAGVAAFLYASPAVGAQTSSIGVGRRTSSAACPEWPLKPRGRHDREGAHGRV